MPELAARLPCPVCLGAVMQKVKIGGEQAVEIDLCGRCGGIWLEQGEVQHLRTHHHRDLQPHLAGHASPQVSQCHNCHAPLDRDAPGCNACGQANLLDCPHCDRRMRVLWRGPLRLDICTHCKGTWFDHHELEALWGPQFDMALQRRNLERSDRALRSDDVADIALYSLFYSPDLMLLGGAVAGETAASTASVMAQLPEAVVASPEAASAVFDVIAETAGGVFETVVEIVAGIFG